MKATIIFRTVVRFTLVADILVVLYNLVVTHHYVSTVPLIMAMVLLFLTEKGLSADLGRQRKLKKVMEELDKLSQDQHNP